MHQHNFSHRDVKLENILLEDARSRHPVLMDFGSVGTLTQDVETRRQVLNIVEEAAQHTTMPYRPPELFEGGVRAGDQPLDYCAVDVWSLGCTLFAILYGASPFESEFSRKHQGRLVVVDGTHLKVIGSIPEPPAGSPVSRWYSQATMQLIRDMLNQDRHKRIKLPEAMERVEQLIKDQGGKVAPETKNRQPFQDDNDDDHHDGIALISTNRLV